MTKDDIIKWAQQWGDWNGQTVEFNDVGLERFAALVAAAERERLAKALDHQCRGMSDYFEVKWIRELATALRRNP
jgi:hypothetical protein